MSEIMQYTRSLNKLPPIKQTFHFLGDQSVTQEEYVAAMSNTYLPKFPLAEAMMDRYKIPFVDEDKERVKRLLVATGWLDHFVDESPDRRAALGLYDQLILSILTKNYPSVPAWARPELLISLHLAGNALKRLPAADIDQLITKALRIGELSILKATSKTIKTYGDVVAEEGALSGDLIMEALSPSVKACPQYVTLHSVNQIAVRAANLLDASIDLPQDYRDGLSRLSPSLCHRLILFTRAMGHLPATMKGLGLKGTITAVKVGLN